MHLSLSYTHTQALSHFEAAESARPGFFSFNWLYLGKTHYQLSNKKEARSWLTKVMELQKDGPEHKEVHICTNMAEHVLFVMGIRQSGVER